MDGNNLLPCVSSEAWRAWSPRPALAPAFEKVSFECEDALECASAGFERYGKWLCDVSGITGGATYRFGVECKPEHAAVAPHAMLTWRDGEGNPVTRDYAGHAQEAPGGWIRFERVLEAPACAESLTAELVFKWSEGGSALWRRPMLCTTGPVRHRIVKVAAAYIGGQYALEGNLACMLKALDRAGEEGADIVCLGETPYSRGTGVPLAQNAVEIPGPVADALAAKAKEHRMYAVVSLNEREGDLLYNTGLLIDRGGAVAGKYRKVQLPLCEAEEGVTPGRDYPVFDTDFGRIGIMICWDHAFPEVARILAAEGAEMLFLPTMWHSEIQARARAADNGVHVVVSAPAESPAPCRIIDPDGEVVASALPEEGARYGLCVAEIDLDKRYYTYWCSVGAAYGEPKSCHMLERRTDTYGPLLL